jgi:hypothetical protein
MTSPGAARCRRTSSEHRSKGPPRSLHLFSVWWEGFSSRPKDVGERPRAEAAAGRDGRCVRGRGSAVVYPALRAALVRPVASEHVAADGLLHDGADGRGGSAGHAAGHAAVGLPRAAAAGGHGHRVHDHGQPAGVHHDAHGPVGHSRLSQHRRGRFRPRGSGAGHGLAVLDAGGGVGGVSAAVGQLPQRHRVRGACALLHGAGGREHDRAAHCRPRHEGGALPGVPRRHHHGGRLLVCRHSGAALLHGRALHEQRSHCDRVRRLSARRVSALHRLGLFRLFLCLWRPQLNPQLLCR